MELVIFQSKNFNKIKRAICSENHFHFKSNSTYSCKFIHALHDSLWPLKRAIYRKMVFHIFSGTKPNTAENEPKANENNKIAANNCRLMCDSIKTVSSNEHCDTLIQDKLLTASISSPTKHFDQMMSLSSTSQSPSSSSSSASAVSSTAKPLSTNVRSERQNKNDRFRVSNNGISVRQAYIMFTLMFFSICVASVLQIAYINRATDIAHLRDGLKTEFLTKNDIHGLMQNLLDELRRDALLTNSRQR